MAQALGLTVGALGGWLLLIGGLVVFVAIVLILWSQENSLTNKPPHNGIAGEKRHDTARKPEEKQTQPTPEIPVISNTQSEGADFGKQQAKPYATHEDGTDGKWFRNFILNATFTDCVIAVAAIVAIIVTLRQNSLIEDANETAKQAAATSEKSIELANQSLLMSRNEHRAWLAVGGIEGGELIPNVKVIHTLAISNVGKTPARVTKHRFKIYLLNGPQFDETRMLRIFKNGLQFDEDTRSVTVPPGDGNKIVIISPEIPQNGIDKIRAGEIGLYFIGEISYLDISEVLHTTKYLYFFEPKELTGIGEDRFVLTGSHNEMD